MKVREYLIDKYRVDKPTTMTKIEAKAFGIPYPLTRDWLLMYGDREIPQYKLSILSAAMEKKAERQEKRGRVSKFSRNAVDVCRKAQAPKIRPRADVTKDEFLSSFEWRKVRMMALKKYGSKCQCCGATPASGAVMNVDHIKPRKKYPDLALEIDNLQVLCGECNHGKGNWDETDWRQKGNQ